MAGSQRRSDTSPSFSAACSVRFHAPEQSAERRLLSARTVETALGTRSLHLLGWLVMASFLLPTSVARVLTVCTHDPHMLYAMRSSLFNFQGDQISMAYVQYADMTPLIGTDECDILELPDQSLLEGLSRGHDLKVHAVRTQWRESLQLFVRNSDILSPRHLPGHAVGVELRSPAHISMLQICELLAIPCLETSVQDFRESEHAVSAMYVSVVTTQKASEVFDMFDEGLTDGMYVSAMDQLLNDVGGGRELREIATPESLRLWGLPMDQLVVTTSDWLTTNASNVELLQYYVAAAWTYDRHLAQMPFSWNSPELSYMVDVHLAILPERYPAVQVTGAYADELARLLADALPKWFYWPAAEQTWGEWEVQMKGENNALLMRLSELADLLHTRDMISSRMSVQTIHTAVSASVTAVAVDDYVAEIENRFNWILGVTPGEQLTDESGAEDRGEYCSGTELLSGPSGQFANQLSPRGEYSGNANCTWTILSHEDGPLLIEFPFFHLSASDRHDWVRVMEPMPPHRLIAQLSGRSAPAIRVASNATLMYQTDLNNVYSAARETGFTATYRRISCQDIDQACLAGVEASCGADGVCACPEGRGGADCSLQTCLGTRTYHLEVGEEVVLESNVATLYAPRADCRWELHPPPGCATCALDLVFDTLETELDHDYVRVLSSLPLPASDPEAYLWMEPDQQDADFPSIAVRALPAQLLSGNLSGAGLRYKSLPGGSVRLQLVTDAVRQARGFVARVVATNASGETANTANCYDPERSLPECGGHGKCVAGSDHGHCLCEPGYFGVLCTSQVCQANNVAGLDSARLLSLTTQGGQSFAMRYSTCDWDLRPSPLRSVVFADLLPLPVHSMRLVLRDVDFNRAHNKVQILLNNGSKSEVMLTVRKDPAAGIVRGDVDGNNNMGIAHRSYMLETMPGSGIECEEEIVGVVRNNQSLGTYNVRCVMPIPEELGADFYTLRVVTGQSPMATDSEVHVQVVYKMGEQCVVLRDVDRVEFPLACECNVSTSDTAHLEDASSFDPALLECVAIQPPSAPPLVTTTKKSSDATWWNLGLTIGGVVLVVILCAAGAWLWQTNRHLNIKLGKMNEVNPYNLVDLDSPMMKATTFLNRLATRTTLREWVWRRHAIMEEAATMSRLLNEVDNPKLPQLDTATLQNMYGEDIMHFLVNSTQTNVAARLGAANATAHSVRSKESSAASSIAGSDHGDGTGAEVPEWSAENGFALSDISNKLLQDIPLADAGKNLFADYTGITSKGVLTMTAMTIMMDWNLFGPLNINPKQMMRYLEHVEAGYLDNPYHSAAHAADVTSRVAAIITKSGIRDYLERSSHGCIQLLGVVMSAAIHDYAHPGVTNAFAVAMRYQAARAHNDQAVFENNSLYHAWMIAEDPSCNFMCNMKPEKCSILRTTVNNMVLGTDMSKHFDIITTVKSKLSILLKNDNAARGSVFGGRPLVGGDSHVDTAREKLSRSSVGGNHVRISESVAKPSSLAPLTSNPGRDISKLNKEQTLLVLEVALKLSDLGHCMQPKKQHIFWVKRLEQEFFKQGDMEKQEGLPVSPLMDRDKPGPSNGTNQAGFFDVIVMPLCELWESMFPDTCTALYEQALENLRMWREESMRDHRASVDIPSRRSLDQPRTT